jgi:hypothetical protein
MIKNNFKKKILNKPAFHILVIITLGLLAYSNTFDSPFHLDDMPRIVENAHIKDLKTFAWFLYPDRLPGDIGFKNRYIGFLTFALNYKIHGLDVTGYHIVNIIIHTVNALLVYWLVLLTFLCFPPYTDPGSHVYSAAVCITCNAVLSAFNNHVRKGKTYAGKEKGCVYSLLQYMPHVCGACHEDKGDSPLFLSFMNAFFLKEKSSEEYFFSFLFFLPCS